MAAAPMPDASRPMELACSKQHPAERALADLLDFADHFAPP
jgi:hypothetical protein